MADSIEHDGRASRHEAHQYDPKDDQPMAPCRVCQGPPTAPQHPTIIDERDNT